MTYKLILTENTTFQEAVMLLDQGGIGILPVVNDRNEFLGIITDGDIRRAVLNGDLSINKVINRNPKKVNESTSRQEVLKILKEHHLRHMPVVDSDNQFIKIILLEGLYIEDQSNRVVIMAGGLGTRLGTLTKDIPKPMLPIAGKPVLERIIEEFASMGFIHFTICLNYKAKVIQDYFMNGSKWNVNIDYTLEEERMGTAGALTLIEREKLISPFFVINGDILTKIDYIDFMQQHVSGKSLATMAVKQYEEYIPYACVKFDEKTKELNYIVEKPKNIHYINTGVYILDPESLDFIPEKTFFDMPSLFDTLMIEKKKLQVYTMNNHWIDIGFPHDYQKANNHYQ